MKAYIITSEWKQAKHYTNNIFLKKETANKIAKKKKKYDLSIGITCSDFDVEEIEINEN